MVGNDAYAAAIKSLWEGKCTVTVLTHGTSESSGRATDVEESIITEEPCRISFTSVTPVTPADRAHQKTQSTKLFIRSDLQIPAGSKITVTQKGVAGAYRQSGIPAVYSTHQEIPLELWKGWA